MTALMDAWIEGSQRIPLFPEVPSNPCSIVKKPAGRVEPHIHGWEAGLA
jgi:hypothetical protein